MKISALGHVVLRVSDRARAEQFYNGVLGLPICARLDQSGIKMAFFSLGNHHDFAVMEVGGKDKARGENGIGLDHVAFKIGKTLDRSEEHTSELQSHVNI